MRYGIIVDSGCDADSITCYNNEDLVFKKVPLKINVGSDEFSDAAGFDPEPMLDALEAYQGKTSTAAPSPGEWMEAFSDCDEVFAITITGCLSGSYGSAVVAKNMMLEKYPGKKIDVLDTLSTGPEMTLLVNKLAEFINKKFDFQDITAKIRDYMSHTRLLYILEHVDNLVNNGRLSRLEGKIVSVLGIRLLGKASNEGRLALLHKCRGRLKAYEKAVEEMLTAGYEGGKVIISHCRNKTMAEYVKGRIAAAFQTADIVVMKSKGLNSYYAEIGGVLIGFELPAGC
jgi:DegV family protein with EDD domain